MEETNPLVTVNILSYNRKDELRNTLQKVYSQNYKNIEVIVVDNNSSDGSAEMVELEFPLVRLIKLKRNIGIAGWNEGFKIAKGEYVLVLDDDSYPGKNAIELAVFKIREKENTACIAFNVYDLITKTYFWSTTWLPSEKITNDIYWPVFVGCAVFINRRKLKSNNLMPKNYFLYQHELPVSADIYSEGNKILFCPSILAYHNCKSETQYNELSDKKVFKNNFLYIRKYLPVYLKYFYELQLLIFYFTRAYRKKWFGEYLNIVKECYKDSEIAKPISFNYFLSLRRLHLFNFSLISKLKYIFNKTVFL